MSQLEPFLASEPLPPSRNRRSPVRRAVLALVALGVAAAIVVGALLVAAPPGDEAFTGPGTGSVTVTVGEGDSLTAIGRALAEAGVVSSAGAFTDAAAANERAGQIGPGTYEMRLGMGADQAVARMLDPEARARTVVVLPEGLRLAQSVRATSDATGIPRAELRDALADAGDLGLPAWAGGRPEGFLFPATYEIPEGEGAREVIARYLARFAQASESLDLVRRAEAAGRTPYEILVIASLVEAEAKPGDFRKVAAVIENRLDAGMPLQLDSTVAYGLGITDIQLDSEQLASDTPYNTYVIDGLPPTPINSPGEAAIEAALSPADGDWLYFVTVDPSTGETRFTKSYDRFLELKREFQRNLAEQQGSP